MLETFVRKNPIVAFVFSTLVVAVGVGIFYGYISVFMRAQVAVGPTVVSRGGASGLFLYLINVSPVFVGFGVGYVFTLLNERILCGRPRGHYWTIVGLVGVLYVVSWFVSCTLSSELSYGLGRSLVLFGIRLPVYIAVVIWTLELLVLVSSVVIGFDLFFVDRPACSNCKKLMYGSMEYYPLKYLDTKGEPKSAKCLIEALDVADNYRLPYYTLYLQRCLSCQMGHCARLVKKVDGEGANEISEFGLKPNEYFLLADRFKAHEKRLRKRSKKSV